MKTLHTLAVGAAVLLLADMRGVATTPPPHANLLLTVRAASSKPFVSGEPVVIEVTVANAGDAPGRIPKAFLDYVKVRVQQQGKEWTWCISPKETGSKAIEAVELAPAQKWQGELRLDAACSTATPGNYEVSVYYAMPPDIRTAAGKVAPAYEGLWQGELADAKSFVVSAR